MSKKEQAIKLLEEARSLNDITKNENRDLTAEELEKFNALRDDSEKLFKEHEDEIKRDKELRRLESYQAKAEERVYEELKKDEISVRTAFVEYLRNGMQASPESRSVLTKDFHQRAATIGITSNGGFLLPEPVLREIVEIIKDDLPLLDLVTEVQTDGIPNFDIPTRENEFSDAEWTTEIRPSAITAGSDLQFGKRKMSGVPLVKMVEASQDMLISIPTAEAYIIEELAYLFRVTFENGILNGSGANKPLGMLTETDIGIPATRNIAVGSATALTYDGLVNAAHSVDVKYRRSGSTGWVVNDEFVKQARLIKDSDGRPIWQDGLRVGEPPTILGFPITVASSVPNTFEADAVVGMFGNTKDYMFARWSEIQIRVLGEIKALQRKVVMFGTTYADGGVLRSDSMSRLVMGS